MTRKLFAAAVLTTLAALPLQAESYKIDPSHSEVGFTIRHMVSNVRGRFNDFSGTVDMDPKAPQKGSVEFSVKTTSIDTGNADRDKHLRTADFFDVEKYPEITFKSDSVKPTGKNTYNVTGTLTMHGVSKKVTLPVTFNGEGKDPWGNTRAGFETATKLDRKAVRHRLEQGDRQRRRAPGRRRERLHQPGDRQGGPRRGAKGK